MKKEVLTLSMLLGCIGGMQAQTAITADTPLYKEGIITDLSQLKDGDYVLLQDMHAERSGFVYFNSTGSTQYNTNAYYADFNFLDKYYKGSIVFQVKITDDKTYKFLNLGTATYILNNTGSGSALESTTEDANNTFSITAMDGQPNKWRIVSTSNNFAFDANDNPGTPVLYKGTGHPFYIHKLTTQKTETPWYYLAVYDIVESDGRKGNCIENNANQSEGVYAGNKIEVNNLNQIWKLEEDPENQNSFAIVNKSGGSIGNVTGGGAAGARYAFSNEETPIYQFQIANAADQEGVATLNIKRPDAGSWYINAAGGGQGYYLNEWSSPNALNYRAGAWSAVIATELKSTGEGYALGTFSAPYNVELPAGVSAYIATQNNTTSITLQELTLTDNILPANTPVVLKSDTEGFYPMKQTATSATSISETNLLEGTGGERTLSSGAFVLSSSATNEAGFYNYTGSAIGAFKAYLPKTTADGEQVRVKSIQFPGEGTTGINNIENTVESKNAPIYNLKGQQVTNPTKGVYIQNGKKFIVK